MDRKKGKSPKREDKGVEADGQGNTTPADERDRARGSTAASLCAAQSHRSFNVGEKGKVFFIRFGRGKQRDAGVLLIEPQQATLLLLERLHVALTLRRERQKEGVSRLRRERRTRAPPTLPLHQGAPSWREESEAQS